jgi:hypothetical protein
MHLEKAGFYSRKRLLIPWSLLKGFWAKKQLFFSHFDPAFRCYEIVDSVMFNRLIPLKGNRQSCLKKKTI